MSKLLFDRRGNIGLSAALLAPLVISTLALGVDYGSLTLQQRELQHAADLAAISAAASLPTAEQTVADHFRNNGIAIPVVSGTSLLTASGPVALDQVGMPVSVAKVVRGRYTPDPGVSVEKRFTPTQTLPDAVVVDVRSKADLFFARAFMEPPVLRARATASARKEAAFAIGSRLASVNGGLLNQVLSGLLGSTITLDAMDYDALAATDIDIVKTIDLIGTDLNLTAGTYQDVLDAEIGVPELLDAMARSATGAGSARLVSALDKLSKQLTRSELVIDIGRVIDLGTFADSKIGTASNLGVAVDAFSMISTATAVANHENQIASRFDLSLPGIASARVSLAVGEPPVFTPSAAVGETGTIVRTAQTRLLVELETDRLVALGGARLRVPLYLELAHAEARLADATCKSGMTPTVKLEAVPGIAEVSLGEVDPKALVNFGAKPRVTTAKLLDTALIDISALGYTNATNLTPTVLSFDASDIASARVKSVSTRDTLTSLQTSLLKNLDLRIDVAGISLGTHQTLLAAVADALAGLTKPLDAIVYNTLLALGVKVGEADMHVSYAKCRRPVLVQ
ncbi:pilus assembly protein TadG-related protein [Hoeflea olei]|uniref:Uncharacterized protein n=1 Tax=Hoeflea olei TaxID=1480615 RepID=A0A1C1YX08_9HYPH|nr:pilus assembly protein TadG-related protein [Hoeflea olei]OCW57969.1 hypothetical protein AWJ14_04065 [Hoeflea olei]